MDLHCLGEIFFRDAKKRGMGYAIFDATKILFIFKVYKNSSIIRKVRIGFNNY